MNCKQHAQLIKLGKIGKDQPQEPAVMLKLDVNAAKNSFNETYLSVSVAESKVTANEGSPNISSDTFTRKDNRFWIM